MTEFSKQMPSLVSRDDFPVLFNALREAGYDLVGPTVRDHAIVYERINGVEDLPIGWTDEQEAGSYRIKPRNDKALFDEPDRVKCPFEAENLMRWECSDSNRARGLRAPQQKAGNMEAIFLL